jgi:hypothetical protein
MFYSLLFLNNTFVSLQLHNSLPCDVIYGRSQGVNVSMNILEIEDSVSNWTVANDYANYLLVIWGFWGCVIESQPKFTELDIELKQLTLGLCWDWKTFESTLGLGYHYNILWDYVSSSFKVRHRDKALNTFFRYTISSWKITPTF